VLVDEAVIKQPPNPHQKKDYNFFVCLSEELIFNDLPEVADRELA